MLVKKPVVGVSILPRHFPVTAPRMIGIAVIDTGFTMTIDVNLVKEVASMIMIARVI